MWFRDWSGSAGQSFEAVANDALRLGLDELERAQRGVTEARYTITPVKGYPRRMDIDNIAEVIAEIEGEDYK